MSSRELNGFNNQNFFRFTHINKNNRSFESSSGFTSSNKKHIDFESSTVFLDERSRKKDRNSLHRPILNESTCQQLANIIGGQVVTAMPVCVVQRLRDIDATILGRRTRSPLALPFALSFEKSKKRNTLNLGETVILQREINPFLTALRRRGITVTAIHNHWLFEEPRLMYMHWENVGDPFEFARNSIEAAREAKLF